MSFVALYARFERPEALLAHPARQEILRTLQGAPGLSVAELARRVGLRRSVARHHVFALERARFVTLHARDGRTWLFPAGVPAAAPSPAGASNVAQRILELLQSQPLTRTAIHGALEAVPRRTRNHALRALSSRGLIRPDPQDATLRVAIDGQQSDDVAPRQQPRGVSAARSD